ncbi:biliverdin-producing heme oxygenase [soil metagenome]
MKDAHRALREGTRPEHERLDGLFGGFDLSESAGYTRFLQAHAEALLPIEAALDGVAHRVAPDWAERRRSSAILADLGALGAATRRANPYAMDGDDIAAIAGALYVIEGSRLGGKFLARQVGAGLPTSYLSGEQPKGSWAALLDAIDVALTDAPASARALVSARSVFERFEDAGRRWIISHPT